MTDSKGPTMTANRLAMSKALGAAFLSHQVEQLEQKVVSGTGRGGGGGGKWREGRRGQGFQGRGNGNSEREWGRRGGGGGVKGQGRRNGSGSEAEYSTQRRWRDESRGDREKEREKEREEKDADVVVVDVSVLVHGIPHLKKWCREGRQEVVIIPLEALNTLDLLKKGTTSLAQRARAASRILEAQVGTNPRIRVQRDDAFVLWDSIPFSTTSDNNNTGTTQLPASPEWVRRTICCARWEIEHATPLTTNTACTTAPADNTNKPKVVLAVCTTDTDTPTSKDTTPAISASPVPLPAPQPNKFEPRSSGTLVLQWATRAGIKVLAVPPTVQSQGSGPQPPPGGAKEGGRRSGEYGRRSPEDERRGNFGPGSGFGVGGGRGGGNGRRGGGGGGGGGGGHYQQSKPLVERPPAVMAMMEAVSQPSRVVRVLARGEKLDAN